MMKRYKTTESEISEAVLRILRDIPGGEASQAEIRRVLPQYLKLSAADREQSDTRENEEVWGQQVRNIVCHKSAAGNYICEGYLETPKCGYLKITKSGSLRIS